MSIILAVLILGIIIMIHEFGHFLLAKLNGIGVLEFSLGMGPRLFSVEKGGTRYSVKVFPFGGSCAMLGEDEAEEDASAFNNKSVWARISVVAAGPVFNFLLAFVLAFFLIQAMGYSEPVVAQTEAGYPAQAAGIQAGDRILAVNGRSVHSYKDFSTYVLTHPQKELRVEWKRRTENGSWERHAANIAMVYTPETGGYVIGVVFDSSVRRTSNPAVLALQAMYEVEYWVRYVFDSFYMMLHGLVSVNDISGPVGIVTTIDESVSEASPYGLRAVLYMLVNFSILLSANLGVVNLLPIPALDGGRLVFLLIELLRGKPIDKEKEGMVHMAGMMVLLGLMVLILFNDVRKLL